MSPESIDLIERDPLASLNEGGFISSEEGTNLILSALHVADFNTFQVLPQGSEDVCIVDTTSISDSLRRSLIARGVVAHNQMVEILSHVDELMGPPADEPIESKRHKAISYLIDQGLLRPALIEGLKDYYQDPSMDVEEALSYLNLTLGISNTFDKLEESEGFEDQAEALAVLEESILQTATSIEDLTWTGIATRDNRYLPEHYANMPYPIQAADDTVDIIDVNPADRPVLQFLKDIENLVNYCIAQPDVSSTRLISIINQYVMFIDTWKDLVTRDQLAEQTIGWKPGYSLPENPSKVSLTDRRKASALENVINQSVLLKRTEAAEIRQYVVSKMLGFIQRTDANSELRMNVLEASDLIDSVFGAHNKNRDEIIKTLADPDVLKELVAAWKEKGNQAEFPLTQETA